MTDITRRQALVLTGATLGAAASGASPLEDLIAASKPSVCAVGTFNALDSPRFTFRGTGFVVGDGSRVATCWHVLPQPGGTERPGVTVPAVQWVGADGTLTVREAEVIGSDRARDLALLRIKGQAGPPLTLGPPTLPREGTRVALMGFPIGGVLGFRHVTHRGIVASVVASALPTLGARQLTDGAVQRLREGSFEMLQLDATAYPGNSGGPLFEVESGRVIGVVNMVLLKGNRESALSQPTGITYAVPVRYLLELLARAPAGGDGAPTQTR